jgi:hypothetical protein
MKKQANKKLSFSTETLRTLTSGGDLGLVAGGVETTFATCGCTTTVVTCRPTVLCTTAPTCG